MNQRERIAKAMYEAPDPDQTESTTPWPPSHPEDLAWWLSRADAALTVFEGAHTQTACPECRRPDGTHKLGCGQRHTPANVSEPGKTDVPSAQMSVSGQIPTDDEREALIAELRWLAEARKEYETDVFPSIAREVQTARQLADILERKTPVTEGGHGFGWIPSWRWDEWDQMTSRTVQGEPSDAQIKATARAIFEGYVGRAEGFDKTAFAYDREKAEYVAERALRAAAAVQGGETR